MKKITVILFATFFLCSCQETNTGMIRMDKFVMNYRNSFVESDLTLFNYTPRVKFENYSDSVAYRIFRRPDNKLLISVWTDREHLDTADKTQKFLADYIDFIANNKDSIENYHFDKIRWLDKGDENNYVLIGDSNKVFEVPKSTFDFDPISYFASLDTLVDYFGILEIKKNKKYIQLIFDSDNSLLYFHNKPLTEDTLNLKLIEIDEKWYKSQDRNNTDYY